jgi:hypothetical protein
MHPFLSLIYLHSFLTHLLYRIQVSSVELLVKEFIVEFGISPSLYLQFGTVDRQGFEFT